MTARPTHRPSAGLRAGAAAGPRWEGGRSSAGPHVRGGLTRRQGQAGAAGEAARGGGGLRAKRWSRHGTLR